MAITLHVNGPAVIYAGTGYDAGHGGSPGALSNLGISTDGVELDWQYFFRPIQADTGGPDLPVTYQRFGKTCRIGFDLVIYDETVLAGLRTMPGATGEGLLESVGGVLAPTDCNRILVDSPIDAVPWNFPTVLMDGSPVKVGTVKNVYRVSMIAFAYIGTALVSTGSVLYNRVTTGKP